MMTGCREKQPQNEHVLMNNIRAVNVCHHTEVARFGASVGKYVELFL